jgi:DNA-binding MarR family transcriptional regulator
MNATLRQPSTRVSAPPLGEELEFLRLIWAVDHGLQTASKRMQRTVGVTGPQRLVLRLLARFPGVTMARVALFLRVHPSTAGGIVKRLEARGWVHRRSDPRDRRRAYLGLTPAGRDFDAGSPGLIEAAVRRTLHALPPPVVEHAREALVSLGHELSRVKR